jgi:RNase adapter protein RapZ
MSTAHLLLVTGLSGAGKTQAMKVLEDLGFFCIDNLPPTFLPQLTKLSELAVDRGQRIAVAMDVRGRTMFADLFTALDQLQADGVPHQILFLDCADDVLVRRYSETRRRHPIADGHSLYEQIETERRLLAEVRDRADLLLDTSHMSPHDLKARLARIVLGRDVQETLDVDVMSFGFKHGVPLDADLMFDVRFLPNPYYDRDLRPLTGLDEAVADYVLGQPETGPYLEELIALLSRWIPLYGESGKARLTVAIGCTGGQHRSVTIAEAIAARLRERFEDVTALHRDLPKARAAVAAAAAADAGAPGG